MNTFEINLLWFNLDPSYSFSLMDVNHSVIISANKFFFVIKYGINLNFRGERK